MLNLLIVDDERLTREGLHEYISQSELNIGGVYSVPGGLEALELMKNQPINILLCDVKMPHMDGIELATIVRSSYPDSKIIFLSGYSDKEYLKSAILLKAESYIEKPINLMEIDRVLSEVISKLERENNQKETDELMVSGLVETFPLVKQELALALISPDTDTGSLKSRYSRLFFSWDDNSSFTAVCIRPDRDSSRWKGTKELINRIYTFLESSLNPVWLDFFSGQTDNGNIALLVNGTDRIGLQKSISCLQKGLYENLKLSVTIGISACCRKQKELTRAYGQAQNAVLQGFYLGAGQIITFDGCIKEKPLDMELFSNLTVNFNNVRNLFEILERERFSDIENIKKQLYALYRVMLERTMNNAAMPFEEFEQYTLAELRELILFGMHALQTLGDDQYDIKIKKAIHFILWNYFCTELSVKMIADHIGLSQNYLSSLFKQNTKSTVNDFIIKVRMEKAKRFLKTTDLKLYEIAGKVGITDPNYLSALFKNYCGETPSQYRQVRPL